MQVVRRHLVNGAALQPLIQLLAGKESTATLAGIPRVLAISAMAEAKCTQ